MENKFEMLRGDIADSDFLLIGIGEEFEAGMKVLEESDIYKVFLEKLRKENLEERLFDWMYPAMLNHALSEPIKEGTRLYEISKAYENLIKCIEGKNYFIVTMNMDAMLQNIIGEDANVTAPFGSYLRMQCENGCEDRIEDAESYNKYVTELILSEDIPLSASKAKRCEVCGGEIVHNTINSVKYLEKGYLESWEKYQKWLLGIVNRKICIIECGVSLNCPGIIRFPFEKIGYYSQKSKFYRINHQVPQLTPELSERGISINDDSVAVFANLI